MQLSPLVAPSVLLTTLTTGGVRSGRDSNRTVAGCGWLPQPASAKTATAAAIALLPAATRGRLSEKRAGVRGNRGELGSDRDDIADDEQRGGDEPVDKLGELAEHCGDGAAVVAGAVRDDGCGRLGVHPRSEQSRDDLGRCVRPMKTTSVP